MSIEDLLEKGLQAFDQGDFKAAEILYQQALEGEKTAEVWLLLAEAQIENGSYGKAHKSLSAGLLLEADNVDLLYSLGDLYLEEENYDLAVETYKKIIES
ncbi:tetratricopeptide repeat protein [uncultured Desulfuromusa sp.]|uniref:tetratricopeptide repeat protein n=1 Tax=uncultured Desulfuromusa sp. TaxID=219183 RepID=UPI002AA717CF|nr:tetratricopeptide repeat protein [uncultured Desulfuromusa sp.]